MTESIELSQEERDMSAGFAFVSLAFGALRSRQAEVLQCVGIAYMHGVDAAHDPIELLLEHFHAYNLQEQDCLESPGVYGSSEGARQALLSSIASYTKTLTPLIIQLQETLRKELGN